LCGNLYKFDAKFFLLFPFFVTILRSAFFDKSNSATHRFITINQSELIAFSLNHLERRRGGGGGGGGGGSRRGETERTPPTIAVAPFFRETTKGRRNTRPLNLRINRLDDDDDELGLF
tara:strand:- start:33 stop:386 length:354 start_codon:yes stop_codon:yes gene_type:complete